MRCSVSDVSNVLNVKVYHSNSPCCQTLRSATGSHGTALKHDNLIRMAGLLSGWFGRNRELLQVLLNGPPESRLTSRRPTRARTPEAPLATLVDPDFPKYVF